MGSSRATVLASGLPQHPDQTSPAASGPLAIDQELGEGASLRVTPGLPDPFGALEVREHEDVKLFVAGSRSEGIQACPLGGVRADQLSPSEPTPPRATALPNPLGEQDSRAIRPLGSPSSMGGIRT